MEKKFKIGDEAWFWMNFVSDYGTENDYGFHGMVCHNKIKDIFNDMSDEYAVFEDEWEGQTFDVSIRTNCMFHSREELRQSILDQFDINDNNLKEKENV